MILVNSLRSARPSGLRRGLSITKPAGTWGLTLALLLGLALWSVETGKPAQAAWALDYPLDPANFTSLGSSPFTTAGTYTIDASKNNANPILTKPDNTTITGVFFSPSNGATVDDEIAVFTFAIISIPATVTVQGARTANSRPVALLSKADISIDGILDVSGVNGSAPAGNNGGAGGAAGPGGGGGGGGGGGYREWDRRKRWRGLRQWRQRDERAFPLEPVLAAMAAASAWVAAAWVVTTSGKWVEVAPLAAMEVAAEAERPMETSQRDYRAAAEEEVGAELPMIITVQAEVVVAARWRSVRLRALPSVVVYALTVAPEMRIYALAVAALVEAFSSMARP